MLVGFTVGQGGSLGRRYNDSVVVQCPSSGELIASKRLGQSVSGGPNREIDLFKVLSHSGAQRGEICRVSFASRNEVNRLGVSRSRRSAAQQQHGRVVGIGARLKDERLRSLFPWACFWTVSCSEERDGGSWVGVRLSEVGVSLEYGCYISR